MKKFMVLTAGVLFSTLVFANDTDGLTSSVAVMNSGSNLFKVFYKAPTSSDVRISIRNEKMQIVFFEKVKKTDGFMRPYNFENLPEGQYTIEVADENGTQIEKVTYGAQKIEKQINVVKLGSEDGRYLLTGISKGPDNITVRIYDAEGRTTYQDTHQVDGKFAQLFNLKNLKGAFTIEVSDSSGILKTSGN